MKHLLLSCLFFVLVFGLAKAQCPMPYYRAGLADACFRADGQLVRNIGYDASFQQDGKIILGGYSLSTGLLRFHLIERLHTDGSIDTSFKAPIFGTFPPNEMTSIRSVHVLPDGKILAGGYFFFPFANGDTVHTMARFNPNGSFDTTFKASQLFGLKDAVYVMRVLPNGKIMVGCSATGALTQHHPVLRLHADGTLDSTFGLNTDINGAVFELVVQPDGKVLVGGGFNQVNNRLNPGLTRLDQKGDEDPGFAPQSFVNFRDVALQADGKIIVGNASQPPYTFNTYTRLHPDGTRDSTFNLVPSPAVMTRFEPKGMTQQADGKLYLSALFERSGRLTQNGLLRLNSDGSIDSTFLPGSASFWIGKMDFDPEGKLLVFGNYTEFNGVAANGMVRLHTTTQVVGTEPLVQRSQLALYPNPASRTVTMTTEEPVAQASLVSAEGKVVPIILTNNTFSVAGIAAGIYTAVVRTRSGKVERTRLAITNF